MDSKYKFDGGAVVLRDAGQTFEQGTGKKVEWAQAVVIVDGTHKIALTTRDAIMKLFDLQHDEKFMAFLDNLQ